MCHTDSVHFRNTQKDTGCFSNFRNPHWVVLAPLRSILQTERNFSESVSSMVRTVLRSFESKI